MLFCRTTFEQRIISSKRTQFEGSQSLCMIIGRCVLSINKKQIKTVIKHISFLRVFFRYETFSLSLNSSLDFINLVSFFELFLQKDEMKIVSFG